MEKVSTLCYYGAMEYGIVLREQGRNGYYVINWSPLALAERWTINARVPALGGVFEIYRRDERKRLRMLWVGNAHYGGLRSEIRRLTDPELTVDRDMARILAEEEIWFRYALTDSAAEMDDVVWFFRKTYFPEHPGVPHSGRFERVFLKEEAPDKLIWVP